MGKSKGGLGRDFYSLLDDNSFESKGPVTKLALKDIQARRDQPRKDFDMNALQLLADSIREHGVIQPILVREIEFTPGKYEIVAGERRFRAAEMAGIDEIPVSIMTGDDLEVAKVALIENVQRRDLNPIEEAMAYRVLMDRFGLTQDQVAAQAGKNRSTVANLLRLLDLPEPILEMLRNGSLSAGHARAVLMLEDEEKHGQTGTAHRGEGAFGAGGRAAGDCRQAGRAGRAGGAGRRGRGTGQAGPENRIYEGSGGAHDADAGAPRKDPPDAAQEDRGAVL
ncbi:MAG: ParB/RepB/Spo0J family partition protein [Oscillospiraceae bacterium]|nr:MAG: ParB/RepB/Spo0J family partition protein [Oscillospiraceae bacterium]